MRKNHRKRAYTVVELAMTGMLVAIVAGLAVAPASSVDSAEAQSAGRRFSGMIEYGQSLAIARPDVVYLIKVNPVQNKFWLALNSAPDTPLTHPVTKGPYVITLGANSTDGLNAIRIVGYDFGGDDVVKFDAAGALDQTGPATIDFSSGGSSYTATVDSWTGTVRVKPKATVTTTLGG